MFYAFHIMSSPLTLNRVAVVDSSHSFLEICGLCVFRTQQTHQYFSFDLRPLGLSFFSTKFLALNKKGKKKKNQMPGDLGTILRFLETKL